MHRKTLERVRDGERQKGGGQVKAGEMDEVFEREAGTEPDASCPTSFRSKSRKEEIVYRVHLSQLGDNSPKLCQAPHYSPKGLYPREHRQ